MRYIEGFGMLGGCMMRLVYKEDQGWKWYPWAPQMPHANVLDLSVFPAMSRRYCNLIMTKSGIRVVFKMRIGTVLKNFGMHVHHFSDHCLMHRFPIKCLVVCLSLIHVFAYRVLGCMCTISLLTV